MTPLSIKGGKASIVALAILASFSSQAAVTDINITSPTGVTNIVRGIITNNVGNGKILQVVGTNIIGIATNSFASTGDYRALLGETNVWTGTNTFNNVIDIAVFGNFTYTNGAIPNGILVDTGFGAGLASWAQTGPGLTNHFGFIYPTNIVENQLLLSDNTNNDASTNKHGFLPKLSGSTNTVITGAGTERSGAFDGDVTNTYNTIIVTNITSVTNVSTVIKGGHVVVSNSFTILTNVTVNLSNLPAPAILMLSSSNTLTIVTNGSGVLTNNGSGVFSWTTNVGSSSGGGDTTGTNVVTLTYSGTNVSGMDFALIQNGGFFKLDLTNSAFIPTPSGATAGRKAWLAVHQPSTGACFVTWTNGSFSGSEGKTLINDTNNNAVVYYELVCDLFTNGLVQVWMSTDMRRMP